MRRTHNTEPILNSSLICCFNHTRNSPCTVPTSGPTPYLTAPLHPEGALEEVRIDREAGSHVQIVAHTVAQRNVAWRGQLMW